MFDRQWLARGIEPLVQPFQPIDTVKSFFGDFPPLI
nr:MAG TPA: YGGT family protein [Caudoviricetes sp.]